MGSGDVLRLIPEGVGKITFDVMTASTIPMAPYTSIDAEVADLLLGDLIDRTIEAVGLAYQEKGYVPV